MTRSTWDTLAGWVLVPALVGVGVAVGALWTVGKTLDGLRPCWSGQ